MGSLSQSGWTAGVIRGGSVRATAPKNTAANLKITPSKLNDSTLGSRQYMNPLAGKRSVAAQGSVYSQPQVPAYLTQALNDLNLQQETARNNLTSFQSRLFDIYNQGGNNSYLAMEGLRALGVQPGSHVTFGQSVQNPLIGEGYAYQSKTAGDLNAAKTTAINRASSLQDDLQSLQEQRARLGANPFGMYEGSPQQKLDQKIMALRTGSTQPLGVAAARSPSGWVSLPTF